jgi:hypothetical protein
MNEEAFNSNHEALPFWKRDNENTYQIKGCTRPYQSTNIKLPGLKYATVKQGKK